MNDFAVKYSAEIRQKVTQFSVETFRTLHTKGQLFLAKEWGRKDWLLVFILAVVVGMAGKTIAIKTITIGYQDYTLKNQMSAPLAKTDHLTQGPLCEE